MLKELKEALIRMGYKEQPNGLYTKPVGFHILVYNKRDNVIYNCFRGNNKKICVWSSLDFEKETEEKEINVEDFVISIKDFECYTNLSIDTVNSKFDINFTVNDYFSELL